MAVGRLQAGGLIQNNHLAAIGITDIPSRQGVSNRLLSELSEQGINVELIVHLIDLEERDHILVCIDRDDLGGALKVVERIREEVGGNSITSNSDVALVSLFGLDFRDQRGVASHMCQALYNRDIKIRAISTSLSTISCLIEAQSLDEAILALRDAFTLP